MPKKPSSTDLAAKLSTLANALDNLPNDARLFYTIDDDGVYLEIGDRVVHLGFDTQTAVKNLREEAGRLLKRNPGL